MRVLLVCPHRGGECGVADYTNYLVEGFGAIGVRAHVVTDSAALRRALISEPFDLVHLQHEYSLYNHVLPEIMQACAGRLPIMATMHTVVTAGGSLHQHPYLAAHCRGIILHSEEARQALIQGGVPASQLMVTNQGCPNYLHTFADPATVRAELGIPAQAFVVGFFGFAFPSKGIVPLVQATREAGVWGFVQASDHWLAPGYLRDVCRDLGIPVGGALDRVQVGQVILSNRHLPYNLVGRYMHAMDIIVLPYWSAPGVASTSAAVRAALAMHRAVVTTQATSFSDLNDDVVLKIPDASVAHIRSAIERLRDNPELRTELAEKARQYAYRNRWEMVARRHIELYRLRGCGPAVPPALVSTYDGHHDALYDIPIQRERVRWLWDNVTGRTAELGCATGYITEQCGGVLGLDTNLNRLMVARAIRRGCAFEQRDITQPLPYPDHAFDTVLLPEVLQDIPFEQVPNVLRESVRVGRRLVITTPNAGKPAYDRALVENPEHLWDATPERIQQLLAAIPQHAVPGGTIKVDTSPGQDFVYATLQRF